MPAPAASINSNVPPQAQAGIIVQAPVVTTSNAVQAAGHEDNNMGVGLKRAANSGDEDQAAAWQTAAAKFQARKPEMLAACKRLTDSSTLPAVPDFGAPDFVMANQLEALNTDDVESFENNIFEYGDMGPSMGRDGDDIDEKPDASPSGG